MAKIKAGLLSLRDLFATAWWIFLIVGIGFYVAYQFVEPAPPVEDVVEISSRLIVNQAALKVKREKIAPILEAFAGAVAA